MLNKSYQLEDIDGYRCILVIPRIHRGRLFTTLFRAQNGKPKSIKTNRVVWGDAILALKETSEATSIGSFYIKKAGFRLENYKERVVMILNCSEKTNSPVEFEMGILVPLERLSRVQGELFDSITEIDSDTGEMTGGMKLKRKSSKRGFSKLKLVKLNDQEYELLMYCQHPSPQGVASVFQSILSRISPGYRFEKTRRLTEHQRAWIELTKSDQDMKMAENLLVDILGGTPQKEDVVAALEIIKEAVTNKTKLTNDIQSLGVIIKKEDPSDGMVE